MKKIKTKIISLLNHLGYDLAILKGYQYKHLLSEPRYKPNQVKLLGKDFHIADSLSFYYSYIEIFEHEIYKFSTSNKTPLIIDCGSNYGASVYFFKQLYPKSKIIAFEADPYIFSFLDKNIQNSGFQDINVLNKAVWKEDTILKFESEKADSGHILNYNIESSTAINIEAVSLKKFLDSKVDFLKIDIEGAEIEVIKSIKAELVNVDRIFIEYHSFWNQEQELDDLLNVLKGANFRYYIQTQFCSPQPFVYQTIQNQMDLQLNIFAIKENLLNMKN